MKGRGHAWSLMTLTWFKVEVWQPCPIREIKLRSQLLQRRVKGGQSRRTSKKKDPASRSGKRRPFPVDAATAPAAINVEDGAAGIRRQLPPVDAAAEATSKKEDPSNLTVDVDDDLSDVSDIQELTAEEDLLKAVGLDESK